MTWYSGHPSCLILDHCTLLLWADCTKSIPKVDVIPDTSGLEISLFKARVVARGRDLTKKVEHPFKDVTPHTDFACLYFLHWVGRKDMICDSLQGLILFYRNM